MNEAEEFIASVDRRLTKGALVYGDRSFGRPGDEIDREVDEELLDIVGWLFVRWCQASRKAIAESAMRAEFLDHLRRRIEHGDIGAPRALPASQDRIEQLAIDAYWWRLDCVKRLAGIAAAIDHEDWIRDTEFRARRGGTRNPRSDD